MRYKLESSAKEPVDHGGARRGRWSWGNRKSNSNANEAGKHLRKAGLSAATTVSVNITVTRRQSGVISLTQIGRCHQSSAARVGTDAMQPELSGGAIIKNLNKMQDFSCLPSLMSSSPYNHIREDHAPYIILCVVYSKRLLRIFCTSFNAYVNLTATCRRDWTH